MTRVGECVWARKICEEMRACGATVLPYVGSAAQPRGYPDRIVVWRIPFSLVHEMIHAGRWSANMCCLQAWIEFKAEEGKVAPLQKVRIRELRDKGALAVVVRWPNRIEDECGGGLAEFGTLDGVGTGAGLLHRLAEFL